MRTYAQPSKQGQPARLGNLARPAKPLNSSQRHHASLDTKSKTAFDFDFSSIPVHAPGPPLPIQTKLAISAAGDEFEQEADRIAEQVMGAPEPRTVHGGMTAAPAAALRMKSIGAAGHDGVDAPQSVHDALSSPGQPLDTATRAFMEPRFGQDFSGVRVHDDMGAAAAASAISAHAFTAGRDIVFGAGEYAPHTGEGLRLLAHELVHTIQQQVGPTGIQRKIKLKRDNKWYEFGAHWREPDTKEKAGFVTKHFAVGEQKFAKSIVEDMADSADDFLFDDENELAVELTKRLKTSNLMQEITGVWRARQRVRLSRQDPGSARQQGGQGVLGARAGRLLLRALQRRQAKRLCGADDLVHAAGEQRRPHAHPLRLSRLGRAFPGVCGNHRHQ